MQEKLENTLLFSPRCSRKLVQRLSCVANPNLKKKAIMPGKKCKKWASFSISQLQKWVKKLYKVVLELQLYYKKFFKRVKIIDSSTLYHGAYKNTIQFLAVWNELLEYLIVKF